jgi:hypothetical protein
MQHTLRTILLNLETHSMDFPKKKINVEKKLKLSENHCLFILPNHILKF